MEKAKKVLEYYVLTNKLKDVIRTGWQNWGVDRDRVESVAEHVYGVSQLALIMWSEYGYDIDINKVALMIAVHELEETVIGDLTQFQISKEEKNRIGHEAVNKILSEFNMCDTIKNLIMEFDERKTKEAKFAYMCDKLECDIQCKLYDEEVCVDLDLQQNNKTFYDPNVQKLLNEGKCWSEMWMEFGRNRYSYDENFREVSEYAEKNDIKTLGLFYRRINN
jgi:putative hydrolase of HD superfamily